MPTPLENRERKQHIRQDRQTKIRARVLQEMWARSYYIRELPAKVRIHRLRRYALAVMNFVWYNGFAMVDRGVREISLALATKDDSHKEVYTRG